MASQVEAKARGSVRFESGVKRKYKFLSALEQINHNCVYNLKPSTASPGVACSGRYWAIPYASGGGGPVLVSPIGAVGKMEPTEAPRKCLVGHKAAVHRCAFSPFDDGLLCTASDDSYIKAFQVDGAEEVCSVEGTTVGSHAGGARELSFHPSAEGVLLSAGSDGGCCVWDVGAQKELCGCKVKGGATVTALDWTYDGASFLASCRDKALRLFDARTGREAWATEPHAGSRAFSALWAGNSQVVLSAGPAQRGGREVAVLDARKPETALFRKLVDAQTGDLAPIYDEDSAVLWLWGRGDTSAKHYEIDATAATLDDAVHPGADWRTASPAGPHAAACALPKSTCDVMALEVIKFLRLTTSTVEQVTFSVPRTNELKAYYNDDLFHETRARMSSMDADSWAGGEDASPVLASRRPSSNPPLLSERVVQRKVLNTEVVNDRLATEKKDKDKDEAEMDRLAALATQYEKFNVNRSMGAKPGVDATVIDGGEVSESEWDD